MNYEFNMGEEELVELERLKAKRAAWAVDDALRFLHNHGKLDIMAIGQEQFDGLCREYVAAADEIEARDGRKTAMYLALRMLD